MAKYSKVVLMKPDTLKITGYTNIQSAIDNSVSGDTILVYPSTYEEQITLKNGVDILCYAGVDITSNAVDATIIDGGVACVCKFVGDYTIHNTGGGSAFLFTNVDSNVYRTHLGDGAIDGTSGYIAKFKNDIGNVSDSAIYQSGSFVGINTTSPNSALHVSGSINSDVVYKISGSTVLNVLDSLTGGLNNTLVGLDAGYYNNKYGVTAIGYKAGYYNGISGSQSYEGAGVVFIGTEAGYNNHGWDIVGIGYQTLKQNTGGRVTTAVGSGVLISNTVGTSNTSIGAYSMTDNTSGSFNTAVGVYTLQNNTIGNDNTAVGYNALGDQILGTKNTAIGYSAGGNIKSGSNNIFVGNGSGASLITGSNNIIIAHNSSFPTSTDSYKLNIGNTIYGNLSTQYVGIGTSTPAFKLHTVGDVLLGGTVIITPGSKSWLSEPLSDFAQIGLYNINGGTATGNNQVLVCYDGNPNFYTTGYSNLQVANLYLTTMNNMDSSSNISTAAQIWIQGNSVIGADNYAIYSQATDKSYFAGNIGIGTATPSASLHVLGTLIGGSGSSTLSPYSTVLGVGNFIGTGSDGAVAIGINNMITSGNYSFVQGINNLIANQYADPTVTNHVEGISNTAHGNGGHAEGFNNVTIGWCSHAEGADGKTFGAFGHSEGGATTAIGQCGHSEGRGTTAVNWYAHSEGIFTIGLGYGCHSEGRSTMAGPTGSYMCSHAEGYATTTYGQYSHSEGQGASAIGLASHAEGSYAKAIGAQSHAEGYYTTSIGDYSHSEGSSATSIGHRSHAEGSLTKAIGLYSHAEGEQTTAIGQGSHTEGYYTIASGSYSHVQGAYNTINNNSYSFIIGNGTSDVSRSNLIYASGSRFDVYGTLYVSGSSQITRAIIQNLAVYADNTSAISGGLTTSGSMYRTSTGQLMVTY